MRLPYSIQFLLVSGLLLLNLTACEEPLSPSAPADSILTPNIQPGSPQSASQYLELLERQLAVTANALIPLAEIASDNYENTQSFFSQTLDRLQISAADSDTEKAQRELAYLLEVARYGRDRVSLLDPKLTTAQRADFHFFVGTAFLFAGQYYQSMPAEALGLPVPAAQHLILAEEAFRMGQAATSDPDSRVACLLGRARTQYLLGEQSGAVAAAEEAIQLDSSYIRKVTFSVLGDYPNVMQDAIHDRALTNDLQPLPRLDFLDPKFQDSYAPQESPLALFKIEEAYLIQAEAAIANGNLIAAKTLLHRLLHLIDTRAVFTFDDSLERRKSGQAGDRPRQSNAAVAAAPSAPLRMNLVLDRHAGEVSVPAVSGTSVDREMVDALSEIDQALALLYLLRQEVFMAEGQRMSDLGIKFVLSANEQVNNPLVDDNDLTPSLPPFLEAIKGELDAFDFDAATNTCTMMHDLNAVIVANKGSAFVAPFHN